MDVSKAVTHRRSIRQFLPDPVDDEVIRGLLERSSRSPSGGNLQPWRIYVVNGESMTRLRAHLVGKLPGAGEYEIYPANLWDPFRTNRFTVGEALYATIGIARDDKAGRLAQFARNADFFGAPCGFFCFMDRRLGLPQWSDLGMFLQTFMLLAAEAGLDTCPQEFWTTYHEHVRPFVGAPDDELLFCGMAIGYADHDAPINSLVTERAPLADWATFV